MKPSIGRIVHCKNELADVYPAIITAVYADGSLSLTLFGIQLERYIKTTGFAKSADKAKALQWWWPERV